MIDHPDFEALGKYVHASEAFDRALMRRQNALVTLGSMVRKATTYEKGLPEPTSLDISAMRTAIETVAECHLEAEEAAASANKYATAAGRPRIEWKSGY